jgi:hypothetical protein
MNLKRASAEYTELRGGMTLEMYEIGSEILAGLPGNHPTALNIYWTGLRVRLVGFQEEQSAKSFWQEAALQVFMMKAENPGLYGLNMFHKAVAEATFKTADWPIMVRLVEAV